MNSSSSSHSDLQGSTSSSYPSHYESEDEEEEICVDDEEKADTTNDVSTNSDAIGVPHVDSSQSLDSKGLSSPQDMKMLPPVLIMTYLGYLPVDWLITEITSTSNDERDAPATPVSLPPEAPSPRPSSPQTPRKEAEDSNEAPPTRSAEKRRLEQEEEEEAPKRPRLEDPRPSAPNVTVVQPSVHHPMLSYLYQSGLVPPPHLMMPPTSGPPLPWPFVPSFPEIAPSAGLRAHGLFGPPWVHPSYALLQQQHPFTDAERASPPRSHPVFSSPKSTSKNSSQELSFKPYALPEKPPTEMRPPSPGSPRTSPHNSTSPLIAHPRPIIKGGEPSQLSNMERMVSGLEPKPESISFVNMSKIGQCR